MNISSISTISLFSILLLWFYGCTTANPSQPDVCMKQGYEPGNEDQLESSYKSEFSLIDYVKRKALALIRYNQGDETPSEQKMKELCACAIFKTNPYQPGTQLKSRSYEDIFANISKLSTTFAYSSISNYWFSPRYTFPITYCESGSDKCTIMIGLKSKSKNENVRDVYVGNNGELSITLDKIIKFKGIIKNVKME